MRGLFVTFEGIDRSGKTTQARLLCEALGDDAARRARAGRHRGWASACATCSRTPPSPLGAEAEALLFAAARAELVDAVIRPALEEGRVVVSDRFLDSSLAYQGGARGLGVDEVERLNRFATGGLVPDLTFLLDLDPAAAAERAGESDRFEDEGAGAPAGGARGLRAAGRRPTPARWRRVDADAPARRGARRRAGRGRGRAQRGARVSVALAGTEDHPQARMVLAAALEAGPSHAYLFHGPAGTGKRTVARAFAAELLAEGAADPDVGAPARGSTARTPT